MSKQELNHIIKPLPNGGMVLVLDNGAAIPAEAEAMLQALYSRDPKSVLEHLKIVQERGPEKFMASYYVGYGHKSIGDCGTCTIFVEGVSMFTAKAIQDWPLYSGQEVSTRYVDFATQAFVDPVGSDESHSILEDLRGFYLDAKKDLINHLKQLYPKESNEKEVAYDKAITARAFDVLRGFLPGGTSTSLSWHTNLRQAADHIMQLRHHPLQEVRVVADVIEAALFEAFPSSFGHKKYEATEAYNSEVMQNHYYFRPKAHAIFALTHNGLNSELLTEHAELLRERPTKTELPKFLAECGDLGFSFLLDFGSFRDLQRHRAVTQRMPLLTTQYGFERWYLDELSDSLRAKGQKLLENIKKRIQDLDCDATVKQYYTPMGYLVPNRVTGNLPSLIYLSELRSGSTVHPTLQMRAQQIAKVLAAILEAYDLAIYADTDPGRFDVRRGEQDIVKIPQETK